MPASTQGNTFPEVLSVKEMNMILLRKVEELTLHLIEQNKLITKLQEQRNASPDESGKKVEELTLMMINERQENKKLQKSVADLQQEVNALKQVK